MKLTRIIYLTVLLGLLLSAAVLAETATETTEAVKITADRLEVDDLAQQLVFIGNAVARQDEITLFAGRLTVQYAGEKRSIAEITAEGDVRITQQSRVATGQHAVYDMKAERIVLTGSPVVKEGANSVQGHEIILFLDGKRSIVKGGEGGRVEAVFEPGSGGSP